MKPPKISGKPFMKVCYNMRIVLHHSNQSNLLGLGFLFYNVQESKFKLSSFIYFHSNYLEVTTVTQRKAFFEGQ